MGKYEKNYYLGLDVGTDSVGWATTDTYYSLLKYHGEPAWGSHIFEEAELNDIRRGFRSARRRLDRKQQRVLLLQELFADAIAEVDSDFYKKIKTSQIIRDDEDNNTLISEDDCIYEEYHGYHTIHHLICELMNSEEKHDPRVVYLALAWLVSHRGHFLSNISMERLDDIKDFSQIYERFKRFFLDGGFELPWQETDVEKLAVILRKKLNVTNKTKELIGLLYGGIKPKDEITESFPFRKTKIISLLAGGKVSPSELYGSEEYAELKSVSLAMAEEDFITIVDAIGDDAELLVQLRAIYDWTILVESLGDSQTISEAKVKIYEQHKKDLDILKNTFVKKYIPTEYDNIFRPGEKDNYAAYAYHVNKGESTADIKKASVEDFSKYLLKKLANVKPKSEDIQSYTDMIERLQMNTFLPKQKTTNNRVIPYQLYYYEVIRILNNAEKYLSFLGEKDKDGLSTSDKIKSIFMFRIPYFVGPLNNNSKFSWIVRKSDKIYPWNFEKVVDFDASEQNFIQRMTNTCSYIPGEPVLPKESLLYHKYTVLNEINAIKINGRKIPVELKQDIYEDLFLNVKKVTKRKIIDYFICNGIINASEADGVTGIDTTINANLSSNIAFKRLIESSILSLNDVEKIIERASYSEDKRRLESWLRDNYSQLSEEDIQYIVRLKLKEFGRLSKAFLTEVEGVDKETGETFNVITALWNTQNNLMELLSDRFTFRDNIEKITADYYSANATTLEDRMTEMRLSGAVKRSVYRTLDVVNDVVKTFGVPEKVFIEMTRGADPSLKGKRTQTRKQQILDLYSKCKDEDVRELKKQLEEMGDYADNKLQGDKLFLYYMQFGKSMYSGKPIDIEQLGTKLYDIDHIYPQAFVKDDSIINNKVLVLSEENGAKKNVYPIEASIQKLMYGYWKHLFDVGAMSEEKFKRLIRSTPFTQEEKLGFINRQLTETSQSTKAIGVLLKEKYPNTEIVYSKAKLTSEFRQEFDLPKSRLFNDLHHAADAYLNIVTGNVYNMRFSKRWFNVDAEYSVKTKTLFTRPLICNGRTIWAGAESLNKVKEVAVKNNAHFTKFAYFKHGGLFDQMPVAASAGLVPLKKGMDTGKYGGYNKAGIMFFIPIKYYVGNKSEILILSVELLHGKRFLADENFAKEYAKSRTEHIIGKNVDMIEFPMGMRPWKVNTVLSLDGFKICVAGIGSGGKCLIAQPIMQFSESNEWRYYLKKLEMFVEKNTKNAKYVYSEEYDKVSLNQNQQLYDIYVDKYKKSIYSKRVNAPVEIFEKGRDKFVRLSILEQARALIHMHETFGRTSGGCDLQLIGGAGKAAATVNFSSTVSNWKKTYTNVMVVDESVTGLKRCFSANLLELL